MRSRSLPLVMLVVTLLAPTASSIPATFVVGQVDSATGCTPIALGGGCVAWSTALPRSATTFHVAVSGGLAVSAGYDTSAGVVRVAAIEALEGDVRWSVALPGNEAPSGIALSQDGARVYVQLASAVVALDASAGSVLWTSVFENTYEIRDLAPLPSGVGVLVERASRPMLVGRIDDADGRLAWGALVGDESARVLRATSDGSTLLVSGTSIRAFSVATHALLWRVELAPVRPLVTQALVVDEARDQVAGLARVAGASRLATFDLDDGALLWTTPIANASAASSAALSGAAFVVMSGNGAVALDASTGAVRWDASGAPDEPLGTCQEVAASAALVLAGCSLGIKAIDALSGEPVWQRPGSRTPRLAPGAPWAFALQPGDPARLLALDPAGGLANRIVSHDP